MMWSSINNVFSIFQYVLMFFFFFKQKAAYEILTCDWSSDVCSSDLCIRFESEIGQAKITIHNLLISC